MSLIEGPQRGTKLRWSWTFSPHYSSDTMAHCTHHHIRSGTEYVGDIFDEPWPSLCICPLTTDRSPSETMSSALGGVIVAPLLTIQQWPTASLTLHSLLENLAQWTIIKLLKPAVRLSAFAKKHKSEILCVWKTPNWSYRFLCGVKRLSSTICCVSSP